VALSSTLSRHVWEAVAQLACDITNATGRNQHALARRRYRELEAYTREQARRHLSHPFLLETLADFTDSNRKAVSLYRKALRLSTRLGEPKQSILFELARRHLALPKGRVLARRYLVAALAEAKRRRDRTVFKQAAQLLRSTEVRAT
jgi:hypothetical protein